MADRTPRFLFHGTVLLVAAGSVVFGLDWQSAPMPPMPQITVVASAPPVIAVSPGAAPIPPAPNPVTPRVAAPARPAQAGNPTMPAQAGNPTRPVATVRPLAAAPAQPKCDVAACAAAYRTFRESDCTYNPSYGPRRLCTKGVAPVAAAPAPDVPPAIANAEADADAPSNARCNVDACASAYVSFSASDCSYQPNYGPRRMCTK